MPDGVVTLSLATGDGVLTADAMAGVSTFVLTDVLEPRNLRIPTVYAATKFISHPDNVMPFTVQRGSVSLVTVYPGQSTTLDAGSNASNSTAVNTQAAFLAALNLTASDLPDDSQLVWDAPSESFKPKPRAHPQYATLITPTVGQTVFPLFMPCTRFDLFQFEVNGVAYEVPRHVNVSANSATWQGPFDLTEDDTVYLLWS